MRWLMALVLVPSLVGLGCGDDGGGTSDAAVEVFDAASSTPDGILNATDSGVLDANSMFDGSGSTDAQQLDAVRFDATPPDAGPDGSPMVSFVAVVLDNFADDVTGFRFTVASSDIVVTDLGFWDHAQDGLGEAHDVGIYAVSDQALVVSASVPAGVVATLDGEYRYADVAPTTLMADTTYVVLAYRTTAVDAVAYNVQNLVVSPLITYDTEVAENGPGQLAYTNTPYGETNGWFGPSFKAY